MRFILSPAVPDRRNEAAIPSLRWRAAERVCVGGNGGDEAGEGGAASRVGVHVMLSSRDALVLPCDARVEGTADGGELVLVD